MCNDSQLSGTVLHYYVIWSLGLSYRKKYYIFIFIGIPFNDLLSSISENMRRSKVCRNNPLNGKHKVKTLFKVYLEQDSNFISW